MKVLAAPLRQAAYRDLCRLDQQEAHDRTALLGDVSQAPAIPAGVFQRHQSQITRHLLAAVKAFRAADFICALSTSITWQPTPHPARRPAFSSHLFSTVDLSFPAQQVEIRNG